MKPQVQVRRRTSPLHPLTTKTSKVNLSVVLNACASHMFRFRFPCRSKTYSDGSQRDQMGFQDSSSV